MTSIEVDGLLFRPYLSQEELHPHIERVAREILADVGERNPLFVCILNGAFMFGSDIAHLIDRPFEMTFAKYSSYSGLHSTGTLTEVMAPQIDLKDRTVVILEDLADSGFTLTEIKKLYLARGAREVRIAVMLDKPHAHAEGSIRPDYVGKEIPDDFIVGHGLDYNGFGRMLNDIFVVDGESLSSKQ